MANRKISELPEATVVDDVDLVTIVQGGENKKATADLIKGGAGASKSYGEMIMLGNTTGSSATTPTKMVGTTVAGILADFTHTNGRLTYNGTETKLFKVSFSGSLQILGGPSAIPLIYAFTALNGSLETKSRASLTIEYDSFFQLKRGFSSQIFIYLDTNDYIELYVQNNNNSEFVSIYDLQFNAVEI